MTQSEDDHNEALLDQVEIALREGHHFKEAVRIARERLAKERGNN